MYIRMEYVTVHMFVPIGDSSLENTSVSRKIISRSQVVLHNVREFNMTAQYGLKPKGSAKTIMVVDN